MLAENAAEEAAAAAAMGVRRVGAIEDLQCLDEDLNAGERQRCNPPAALESHDTEGMSPRHCGDMSQLLVGNCSCPTMHNVCRYGG